MIVSELIAMLQNLPPGLTVVTDHPMGSHEFQTLPSGVGVVKIDDVVDDNNDPLPAGEYVAFSSYNFVE